MAEAHVSGDDNKPLFLLPKEQPMDPEHICQQEIGLGLWAHFAVGNSKHFT